MLKAWEVERGARCYNKRGGERPSCGNGWLGVGGREPWRRRLGHLGDSSIHYLGHAPGELLGCRLPQPA